MVFWLLLLGNWRYNVAMIQQSSTWQPIDFTIYFRAVSIFVVIAIVGELVGRWWVNSVLQAGPLFDNPEVVAWAWRMVVFVVIAIRMAAKFGSSAMVGAIAGSVTGSVIGLLIAISRFADGFKIWKLFNLLTETTITALVGALAVVLVIYCLSVKDSLLSRR